ncbi:Linear gramicidin synthase subunit D [Candidatus Entotheonellaceae bacterium PAL068K]
MMQHQHIEDVYGLSAVQQGMLFHTLFQPESGVYVQQWHGILQGCLERAAWQQAWQQVVARHPILRTSFIWHGFKEPLQVVHRHVVLAWQHLDWRGLSEADQQARWTSFLQTDRLRGFALNQAPLMRCALIQLADDCHRCIWSSHHLISDGWSAPIIFQEVFAFYEALRQGKTITLKPPRPYRDYIAWLQQHDMKAARTFWRQRLAGLDAPTPLAVERLQQTPESADVCAPDQRDTYQEQEVSLASETTARLQALAGQQRLTQNILLQGAWAVLLSRYSGETEVVFGVTVSGRPVELPGVESMVGMFISTVPMRLQVSPEAALLPWLQHLMARQIAHQPYVYTPLVEIQACSQVPAGTPLFDSIFVYENYPIDRSLQELRHSHVHIHHFQALVQTNYPLAVIAMPGSELGLKMAYDTRRFDHPTIARMLGHYNALLQGIITNPTRKLSELPLLTAAERQQILVEWNDTDAAYPRDKCLHQLFEAQVSRTPEAVAVVYEDQSLTYRGLDARANQLAHYLQGWGIGPETLVGVYMQRCLEMVVGLIGILKAGGAYVPLDPGYPQDRLAFMIEDARVTVLLTQASLREQQPPHAAQVICLDTDWVTIARMPSQAPASAVTSTNLAYVIYTSGSTGKPKGVMTTHGGICNRLLWMQDEYQLTSEDRVLQKTPCSFDVSVWEFFWPLVVGARLVVAQPQGEKDPEYLVNVITSQNITTVHFVPPMLHVFLAAEEVKTCSSLRRVICSGEALALDLQKRFFSRLKAELHNLYGPTEAAIDVTHWACQPDSPWSIVPIGRPVANTQIYLLNQRLQPVPIGVPGELYIGGVQVARGYYDRPELSPHNFIANPFGQGRLYKTGDLARYLPDGAIEFLGRIDNQVKLRGFRIELGEIEAVLAASERVRETVVVVREDQPGDKRLVAYVVLEDGQSDQASTAPESWMAALRTSLTPSLPDYMMPAAFVCLESLPLMPNGKVDRRALPAPDRSALGLETHFVPPRTEMEETITSIWRDVLGLERVGIHDNFFALGGHSLLAMRIISRIREACAIELQLRTLFASPTVAGVAEHLERLDTAHSLWLTGQTMADTEEEEW